MQYLLYRNVRKNAENEILISHPTLVRLFFEFLATFGHFLGQNILFILNPGQSFFDMILGLFN